MSDQNDRINGWKSIGAHFGRDRSTVIRWAQDRGLPVRRMPGGKTATIYALKSELDAWAASHGTLIDGDSETASADQSSAAPKPEAASRRNWAAASAAALLLIIIASVIWLSVRSNHNDGAAQLPRSADNAAVYVQARNDWGLRTRDSLEAAIAGFRRVIAAQPDFAPAHAGLADAYILSHEFGALNSTSAYAQAKNAAERALALDRDSAEAHRALGFVHYWWERDPVAAGQSFRRSLEIRDADPQTHFWYGNILIDNGEQKAGMRELTTARLAMPGSTAVESDYAWALWVGGNDGEALRMLNAIVAREPEFAGAYDCIAEITLSQADLPGYFTAQRRKVMLRGDAQQLAALTQAEAIYRAEGAERAWRFLFDEEMAAQRGTPFSDHSWAAFIASTAGDRAALVQALNVAQRQNERWGSAGYLSRMMRRWANDAEIRRLLASRRRPPVEAAHGR